MNKTIGQCSLCGGAVTVPTVWLGVIPPVPRCERCGATMKQQGPVIEMERPRRVQNHTCKGPNSTTGCAACIEESWNRHTCHGPNATTSCSACFRERHSS